MTTGISAADRACTIAVAIDASKGRPGHRDAGSCFSVGGARRLEYLSRTGHTEAAVDVCPA